MSLARVIRGHVRTLLAFAVAVAAFVVLPRSLAPSARLIASWDIGAVFLLAALSLMFASSPPARMPERAERQQEGEWTAFWITVGAVVFSFVAVTRALSGTSHLTARAADIRVGLVAATLLLSWLVTQSIFAARYAHEWYERRASGELARGLSFPDEDEPDYWDFVYFSVVLGMTFQVSDVAIGARPLRRLAAVHGFLGFVFNTVIVALTVNLAAALV